MNSLPTGGGRDPIAEAIESLLRDMEAEGKGAFTKEDGDEIVQVGFGGVYCEGPTYDIALVRLANALIDDPKYSRAICDILRSAQLPRRQ